MASRANFSFKAAHLKLLWLLLKRDLRLRYAGAGLGSLWNLFHPLLLFTVYALVFGYFLRFKARLSGKEVDFLPFFFAGFWPWMAFNDGLVRCAYIVFEYAAVIKRVRFPAQILVPLATLAALTPLLVGFFLLLIFLLWQGKAPPLQGLRLLCFFIPFGLQMLLSLGLGFLIATLCVFVRDVQQLLPSFLNLWFFLTPVFYSLDIVPDWLRPFLAKNPWSVILAWYRQIFLAPKVLFGQGEGWVLALGLILLAIGWWSFSRGARYFPDIL